MEPVMGSPVLSPIMMWLVPVYRELRGRLLKLVVTWCEVPQSRSHNGGSEVVLIVR